MFEDEDLISDIDPKDGHELGALLEPNCGASRARKTKRQEREHSAESSAAEGADSTFRKRKHRRRYRGDLKDLDFAGAVEYVKLSGKAIEDNQSEEDLESIIGAQMLEGAGRDD
ncbi:hypothetical protein LTR95_006982 [Oleoguttula sp. CCFEE 5521]